MVLMDRLREFNKQTAQRLGGQPRRAMCVAAAAFGTCTTGWADGTIAQTVRQINVNGAANFLYVVGDQKWGTPSCPNATYAQVTASVPGRKDIMAAVLLARAIGARVEFWGSCNANPDYFDANYVVVHPN